MVSNLDLIKKANNKFAAMAQKLAVTETNRESSMNKVCMYQHFEFLQLAKFTFIYFRCLPFQIRNIFALIKKIYR